ncbi:hypothetical protein SMD22_02015 (plasmid) [Brevibacillus halotolerans]|nr:hypothetical protein SMD22_02015 [Brevibacillus halotolerans]
MNIPSLKVVDQQKKKYSVAVLCGGIGGSTLGYTVAGFDVVLSVYSNSKNNMVHWINFPQNEPPSTYRGGGFCF